MSTSEIKKRHMQGLTPNTTSTAANQRKPGARTVTWEEIHEWQRDNKYIRRGYRPGTANFLKILTSLTFLHNETCNVYTHLIGALTYSCRFSRPPICSSSLSLDSPVSRERTTSCSVCSFGPQSVA